MKNKFYERAVVPTVTYGAETMGMKMDERHTLGVIEWKCLKYMWRVSRMDRWRK